MAIAGLKLHIRLISYFLFSVIWGLLFTALFSRVSGYNYMLSFWSDAAISSAALAALLIPMLEIYRLIILRKAGKIKKEIAQKDLIIFDGAVYYLAELPKVFEGWLFLTEKNLIFSTIGKRKKRELTIPIASIQKITRYRLIYRVYINHVLYFQVNKKWYELLNFKLNAPTN